MKEVNHQVKVIHSEYEDTPVHVATVTSPRISVADSLEYAWERTQNGIDAQYWAEADKQSGIQVMGDKRKYRSTAVGDYCEINNELWRVEHVGFIKITGNDDHDH